MRFAAGAMDYPEQVEIFGWEYEARQGMTRGDQSMKWISMSGINELTRMIFGVNAQCHRIRRFQSEPDRDRLWLDSPQKGSRKNEWESSETFGHRYPRHSRHFSGFSILL